MNLNIYDIFVYSSHKTSTQSLLDIFKKNKLKSKHIHQLHNFNINLSNNIIDLKKSFVESLEKYKNINNKKLKIISVIRNPNTRLLSSFFQSYHNDEITFKNKKVNETTITTNNEEYLIKLFMNNINNLHETNESLDEMSSIFNINIIDHLQKKNNYYYFENDLIKLYVLDFNKLISNNNLAYLNNSLDLKLKLNGSANKSENKIYYSKYKSIQQKIPSIDTIIKKIYNPFYFNAF